MYEKDIVLYLLRECNGLHPYHISRLVALMDIKYLHDTGKKLTDIDYQKTPYGFYSEKLPKILEELPVEKVQGEGYKVLVIKDEARVEINLPEDVRKNIEDLLDEVCNLSDEELNSRVLQSPYYRML